MNSNELKLINSNRQKAPYISGSYCTALHLFWFYYKILHTGMDILFAGKLKHIGGIIILLMKYRIS